MFIHRYIEGGNKYSRLCDGKIQNNRYRKENLKQQNKKKTL